MPITGSANCHLDGALCYIMLSLSRKHGVLLCARCCPAEQDGKGGIEAVFGTMKRFLHALQNKGIDAATPRLHENTSPRPQPNFKTELFEIDRARIEEMVSDPKHAAAVSLFKCLKRFGEAMFDGKTLHTAHQRAASATAAWI